MRITTRPRAEQNPPLDAMAIDRKKRRANAPYNRVVGQFTGYLTLSRAMAVLSEMPAAGQGLEGEARLHWVTGEVVQK